MTDFSQLLVADSSQDARDIRLLTTATFPNWLTNQPQRARAIVGAARFTGKAGEMVILPSDAADQWSVAYGVADLDALTPWCLSGAAERLPEGRYRLANDAAPGLGALGWLLAHHQFTRYKAPEAVVGARVLLTPQVAAIPEIVAQAEATALVRDLVNTPAADMGPEALEQAAIALARRYGATTSVIKGDALASGYPLIAAVGRASQARHAPRLIELEWGNPKHPRVAIIGKGVSFDTGGLNLKTGNYMRLMKKDMGGAAHALALAQLIMSARLKVRLHMLLPAAENAIGGDAFRPGDVLISRSGKSIEIDNTDAEGRLVLADAMTKAGEDGAALMIDFATLTGAARVALGPDLPALFVNDDALAADCLANGTAQGDPLWRMPLWAGYNEMLKSDIADLANSPESGFAGSVTAALFLQHFVPPETPWAHLDTFAWRPSSKPGRPKGGEALGLRAVYAALKSRYGS
jgi:leucyl aminopeptidase